MLFDPCVAGIRDSGAEPGAAGGQERHQLGCDEEVAGRHREDCGRRDGEGCPGREFRARGFLRRRRSQGLDLLRLGEMGF
jgi:hypothetical protein